MANQSKLNTFVLNKRYRKKKIPTALRNQVWITYMGERFRVKCSTIWCTMIITPFSFEAGHNIPESKGGKTVLENLIPICSTCNKSMGNTHTFDTWCSMYSASAIMKSNEQVHMIPTTKKQGQFWRFLSCFSKPLR
jgi:hypothetical protein